MFFTIKEVAGKENPSIEMEGKQSIIITEGSLSLKHYATCKDLRGSKKNSPRTLTRAGGTIIILP